MLKVDVYKPRTVVSRYYTVLFSLPKWQVLTAILLAIGVLVVLFMGSRAIPLILNTVFVHLVLYAYSLVNNSTVFYKAKRRIGLALAILVYTAVYTVLTRDPWIPIISSTTMLVVVILGLDGTSRPRYIVAVAPPLLTLLSSWILGYYNYLKLLVGTIVVLTLAFIDMAIYAFMARRKINGYPLPDLGTMFLQNWLDRKTSIEKAFDELGEIQYVYPRIMEFKELLLIYTDVHYGPFSNIGSSRLPIQLSETLKKLGYRYILALHGLGSHDRNIASSRHVELFLDEIVKSITSNSRTPIYYHGAFKKTHASWEALTIVFDKLSLVLISRPGEGIDDLPYNLQVEYELKTRERGLGDLVLIDTHNWELEREFEEKDILELKQLLDEVVDTIAEYRKRPPTPIQYKYKCFKSSAPGLVEGECCILCMRGEGRESVCILYMRGNNAKPGLRNILIEKLRPLGVDYYEVLTNDEHTETGTRARITYIPVHESSQLLGDIEKASFELSREEWIQNAFLYTTRLELKLMGSGIDAIKKQLASSLKESSILLLLYVFATPILLYLAISIL